MKAMTRLLVVAALLASSAGAVRSQDAWKGTAGPLHLENAGTIGKGKLIFSLGTSYYKTSETLTKGPLSFLNGTSFDKAPADFHFFLSRASLTFGLSDYVEFSAVSEVRNWIMQVSDQYKVKDVFETRTRGGIGDTDVLLKICAPMPTKYVSVGVLGDASFPTGKKEARFTTDETDFGVKGLVTVNLTDAKSFVPTRVHLNLGYRFNRNETDGYGILYPNNPDSSGFYPPAYPKTPKGKGNSFNDCLQFGAGLQFLVKSSSLFLEFMWDDFRNAEFALGDTATYYLAGNKSTFTLTPGVKLVSENGVGLTLAADINLNSEKNPSFLHPPDWMVYFMLSVGGTVIPQDQDKDGVNDDVDKCPNTPLGVVVDKDGCPVDSDGDGVPDGIDTCPGTKRGCTVDAKGCPSDSDGDGICDGIDQCPDTPKGAAVDARGCPIDSDGDGVPDGIDECPNTPAGAAVDAKGCSLDSDGDGVPDGADQCPNTPKGCTVDAKGCPIDSDGDGVCDGLDQCPNTQRGCEVDATGCPLDSDNDGVCNGIDLCPNTPAGAKIDVNGCPEEKPIAEKFILRGVNFESGSAALTPDSYAVLDQVVKSLKAYPEVRVEIAGHTDSVGKADFNMKLSQQRAESVMQYLINSGIAADRLVARGYGKTMPIASNATAAGRADNRRIEFRRLN